jgi:hypothetical protein
MTERKLKVNIGANVGGALGGFRRVGDAGSSMGSRVSAGARAAASGLAALAGGATVAGAGAYKLAQSASDMNEGISRSNVVFGEGAGMALDFGKSAATGYGLSRVAAAEATSSIGQLLTATGLVGDDLAKASIDVAKFAGDLSSFANITTDEAIGKVFSGLAGEIEPLRRVGVAMDAAAVEAVALREGFAATKDELTQGDKTMARMILMMELGENIHGDFARTSQDLAQQQRTLSAQFDNTKVALGEVFLPAMSGAIIYLNGAMPGVQEKIKGALADSVVRAGEAWQEHGPKVVAKAKELKDSVSGFYDKVKEKLPAARALFSETFDALKRIFEEVSPLAETFFSLLVGSFSGLGGAAVFAFRDDILPALEGFGDFLDENVPGWDVKLSELWDDFKVKAVEIKDAVLPELKVGLQSWWDKMGEVHEWVKLKWPDIKNAFSETGKAATAMGEETEEGVDSIWETMKTFMEDTNEEWPQMATDIKTTFQSAWEGVKETVDVWKLAWGIFGGFITGVLIGMMETVNKFAQGFIRQMRGVLTFLKGVFTLDWGLAWEGIKEIYFGLWDQLTSYFEVLEAVWEDGGAKLVGGLAKGITAGFWGAMRGLQSAYNATIGKIPFAPSWDDYIGPHAEQGRPAFGHEGNPNRGIFPNFDPMPPKPGEPGYGMVNSSIVSGKQALGGHNSNAPSIVNFNNFSTTPTDVTGVGEMLAEAAAFSGGDNQSGQYVTTRSPF